MMCSGLSHAQGRETHFLGTVQTIGPIHQSPCGFHTPSGDAWNDPSHPELTLCYRVAVSDCPNSYDANNPVPQLVAYVAVTQVDPNFTPRGTIVLLSGDGGTGFFNAGGGTPLTPYVQAYHEARFTTVQVAWTDDWDDNTDPDATVKSVKDEACRPATLLKLLALFTQGVNQTFHRFAVFCGHRLIGC